MSILSLRPGRTERHEPIAPPISYAPKPKPAPIGPHQLGNATLTNVETLTNMSADEIDKLADAVDAAAHETSDGLRAFAHKLRATGRIANEQLANFVHVASTCAEAGRHMQAAIEKRDEAQPDPPAEAKPADIDAVATKAVEAASEGSDG